MKLTKGIGMVIVGLIVLATALAQPVTEPIVITFPAETQSNATGNGTMVNSTNVTNTFGNATGMQANVTQQNASANVTEPVNMTSKHNNQSIHLHKTIKAKIKEEDAEKEIELPEELAPFAEKLTAATATALEQDDEANGTFIIAFKDTISNKKKARLLGKALAKKELGTFKGATIQASIRDMKDMLQDADVQYVEIDQDLALFDTKGSTTPKDEVPWGVQEVKSWVAWNETLGEKVKIAVLDSGIAPHKDLKVAGGAAIVGQSYEDTNGHGTQVAGVIAAALDGKGIVGNAPKAELYAVKITEGESGKLSDAIEGLQWAIDNEMDIASMSFGFNSYSQIFKEKVQEAYSKGMVLIASSGNDGEEKILYPAKYSKVIAVGAVTKNLEKASFSNYGDDLELVAPGENIKTTTLDNDYLNVSGTSYATPHVTGVVALIKALYPTLSSDQIRAKLRKDAIDVELPGYDKLTGYGLVQFHFGAENVTPINESYYYEIFKVLFDEDFKYFTYWLNGTGSIDDVNYPPGRYLALKYNTQPPTGEEFLVDENQTFELLGFNEIGAKENFTSDDSGNNDFRIWKNEQLNVSYKNPKADTDAYCFDLDYNGTIGPKAYDLCRWVDNDAGEDDKAACGTYSQSFGSADDRYAFQWICFDSAGNCTQDNPAGTEVFESVSNAVKKGIIKMRFYQECDQDVPFKRGTQIDQDEYFVYDQRRILCDSTDPNLYRIQGRYNITPDKWDRYKLTNCAGNEDCDTVLDEQVISDEIAAIPSVCRLKDGEVCTSDAECLTGHGCLDGYCGGATACNGTIQAITEDREGLSMDGLNVYIDDSLKGTTDFGFLEYNVTGACTRKYNLTVKCSDGTTVCGSDIIQVNVNNQYDGTEFDCTKCNNKADLHITKEDVSVYNQSTGSNITLVVHNDAGTASNVVVRMYGIDRNNQLLFTDETTISSIAAYAEAPASLVRPLSNVYFLSIQVDPDNVIIADQDKANNFVQVRPDDVFKPRVALKIFTGVLAIDDAIYDYLKSFVLNASEAETNTIVAIGSPRTNQEMMDNNAYTLSQLGWGFSLNGLGRDPVMGRTRNSVYPGYVGTYNKNAKRRIYAAGNELPGMVNAARATTKKTSVLNQRIPSYFVPQQKKPADIKPKTIEGVGTGSYFYTTRNKPNMADRSMIAQRTKKALTEQYSTARKRKYITTDGIQLQAKEVIPLHELKNITKKIPVILARGLWSSLNDWRQFGEELSATGRDTWLIEITGGPNQDCVGKSVDNCPDYTFNDLTNSYFPTLIDGVLLNSGQTKFDYVGYDNGCRVAISSLEKGKVDPTKVDTFVGTGCPGAFKSDIDLWKSPFIKYFRKYGDIVLSELSNKKHIDAFDLGFHFSEHCGSPEILHPTDWGCTEWTTKLSLMVPEPDPGSLLGSEFNHAKVSRNLINDYLNWVKSDNDEQPGTGLNLNRFVIISGRRYITVEVVSAFGEGFTPVWFDDDGMVTLRDGEQIYQNIISNKKSRFVIGSAEHNIDDGERTLPLADGFIVKSIIKREINNESLAWNWFWRYESNFE